MRTIAGVVGVAIGAVDGQPVIKLLVVKKTPELEQKIPKMVEGYPVVLDNRRENLRIVTNRANPHNTRDNAEVIGIRGHGQGHHVQLQIASGLASRTSREQT